MRTAIEAVPRRIVPLAAVLTLLLSATARAQHAADTKLPPLIAVGGRSQRAELSSVPEPMRLEFRLPDGQIRMLDASQLVRWGAPAEAERGMQILLVGDGVLVADVLSTDGDRLTVDSYEFGELSIPLEFVEGIFFETPRARQQRDDLDHRVREAEGPGDRLLLAGGDVLTGAIQRVRDVDVTIDTDVGTVTVDTMRIAAAVFDPTLAAAPPGDRPRLLLGTKQGSRLPAIELREAELDRNAAAQQPSEGDAGPVIAFDFYGPDVLSRPLALPLADVVYLQGFSEDIQYLSDLDAADYRHIPYLSLEWPFRLDWSVTRTRLRHGDHLYLKGLGLQSAARLTYRIDDGLSRFVADAVIDEAAGFAGSAQVRVYVDGKQAAASQVLRGDAPAERLEADVRGARRLDLLITHADRGDVLDHVDLLEARFER